ncbi:MAG: OmpA family protein [Acidobacteria bacterium]|nr:OmpA family protein [Acidobacteriota bacterium]
MRRTILAIALICSLAACSKKKPVAAAVPNTPKPAPTAAPSNPAPQRQTAARTNAPATVSTPRTDGDAKIQKAIRDLNSLLSDAFFDFDKYTLRPDAVKTLTESGKVLREAMTEDRRIVLTIEGHCDERGSAEYNTALGDKRASEARNLLVQLGVPDGQMKTVSYGAERPVCTESTEDCWQKNRRAHVVYARN